MLRGRNHVKRYLDFPRSEYETRYAKLRTLMARRGIDALLVTIEQNVRYFTGLNTLLAKTTLRPITALLPASGTREPVMVVPEVLEGTCLATAWVESIRLSSECYGKPLRSVIDVLLEAIRDLGLSTGTIGMEFGTGQRLGMTHEELGVLRSGAPGVEWVDAADVIWRMRTVKSTLEVEALKTACEISAAGIEAGFDALRPGLTERDLYKVITSTYYKEGAESHLLIFHSGAKGYQTRDAAASDYPFERGHFAKVDGGVVYKGYCCEFCRIVAVGPLLDSQRHAMRASAMANAAAISEARSGVPISVMGAAVDRVLEGVGLVTYMNSIGHGVGLDPHEPPWLDRTNAAPVEQGMVLSIEVGVIDPDRFDDGSYTFEENLVVTEDGTRLLTDRIPPEILETS